MKSTDELSKISTKYHAIFNGLIWGIVVGVVGAAYFGALWPLWTIVFLPLIIGSIKT